MHKIWTCVKMVKNNQFCGGRPLKIFATTAHSGRDSPYLPSFSVHAGDDYFAGYQIEKSYSYKPNVTLNKQKAHQATQRLQHSPRAIITCSPPSDPSFLYSQVQSLFKASLSRLTSPGFTASSTH